MSDENKMSEEEMAAQMMAEGSSVGLSKVVDESTRRELGDDKFDRVMDIPVRMTLEVGGVDIPIRTLLQLNQGSVIELDRVAGEPLDVKINGALIAHGEVVVVNESYGIRLTDVISPEERVKQIR